MEMFEMDEFMQLGDVWAQDQMFDVNHFDDLGVTEAKHGLYQFSLKPKPRADASVDLLHDLIDTPVGGYLGEEWLEQPNLLQYLHTPALDDSPVTDPIPGLLGDTLSLDTPQSDLSLDTSQSDVSLDTSHYQDVSLDTPHYHDVSLDTPQSDLSLDAAAEAQSLEPASAPVSFLQNLLQQQEELMDTPCIKVESLDTPCIKVESPVSTAPSSPAQVAPVIDLAAASMLTLEEVLQSGEVEFIQAPLSPDDVESLLSSTASSPSTVDVSSLYSEDGSILCNTSDLYEVVSNDDKRSRSSPYSRPGSTTKSPKSKSKGRKLTACISPDPSELEMEMMSKKDRKKLQNKNAAIRYRMKKKVESDTQRAEEDELQEINNSLQEKVDELAREIKYMKGLICDVRKARGLPAVVI